MVEDKTGDRRAGRSWIGVWFLLPLAIVGGALMLIPRVASWSGDGTAGSSWISFGVTFTVTLVFSVILYRTIRTHLRGHRTHT